MIVKGKCLKIDRNRAQRSVLVADTHLYKRLCPSGRPSVRPWAQVEKWGVGYPCPPVRNDIVTPRHMFYQCRFCTLFLKPSLTFLTINALGFNFSVPTSIFILAIDGWSKARLGKTFLYSSTLERRKSRAIAELGSWGQTRFNSLP